MKVKNCLKHCLKPVTKFETKENKDKKKKQGTNIKKRRKNSNYNDTKRILDLPIICTHFN